MADNPFFEYPADKYIILKGIEQMEYCRIFTKNENQMLRILYETDQIPKGTTGAELAAAIPGIGKEQCIRKAVTDAGVRVELLYPCETEPACWDEFSGQLYEAKLRIRFFKADRIVEERTCSKRFGCCDVGTLGTQFIVNRHITFLRAVEICPETVTLFSGADWLACLSDLKARGLNCISVHTSLLSEALFDAADSCGIYVKAHTQTECGGQERTDAVKDCQELIRSFGNHPSFAMLSGYEYSEKGLNDNQLYSGGWMEFAVRDRQDYSDAPDTKSNHIEDIRKQDCPTLVTNVGEWRNPVSEPAPGLSYLAQICTREAMEEALRTPKFGGFCLHSDAAVLALPQRRMREFAGTVVPLLMMKKYVWSADETFSANMMIANYGKDKLFERVSVSAYDEHGQCYAVTSNKIRINSGGVMNIGQLSIPLGQFMPGQRLELTISIDNTGYRNHYAVWLFSDDISVKVPEHVHITRKLDERMRKLLLNGKKVVYIPKLNRIKGEPGWFSPLASEVSSNRERVASGGISCEPGHPALRGFPTEEMADFQWWHLLHNSIPVRLSGNARSGILVSMPGETDESAERALIFEACVGKGRLLVCTIDLLIQLDRPEARQLYASLLSYAASPGFSPAFEMSMEELEEF